MYFQVYLDLYYCKLTKWLFKQFTKNNFNQLFEDFHLRINIIKKRFLIFWKFCLYIFSKIRKRHLKMHLSLYN